MKSVIAVSVLFALVATPMVTADRNAGKKGSQQQLPSFVATPMVTAHRNGEKKGSQQQLPSFVATPMVIAHRNGENKGSQQQLPSFVATPMVTAHRNGEEKGSQQQLPSLGQAASSRLLPVDSKSIEVTPGTHFINEKASGLSEVDEHHTQGAIARCGPEDGNDNEDDKGPFTPEQIAESWTFALSHTHNDNVKFAEATQVFKKGGMLSRLQKAIAPGSLKKTATTPEEVTKITISSYPYDICPKHMKKLCPCFSVMSKLEKLSLVDSPISYGHVVCSSFASLVNLKELRLYNNGINDAGVEKLAAVLPKLKELTFLDLKDNAIRLNPGVLEELAAKLPSTLERLYIDHNFGMSEETSKIFRDAALKRLPDLKF